MNRTTLIIVACGFFFALLAAMAVQMLGGKSRDETPVAQSEMVDVLIAAKDLGVGEELSTGATSWSSWPKSATFSGAIIREGDQGAGEALKGRTRRAIAKGEPMLTSAMISDTEGNFVAAALKSGKRAIAVNVNAQTSVAGFVMPGDYVDVILTYDVKLPGDEKIRKAAMPVVNKMAAETVLENIKVLATDQDTGKKEAKVVKTVTLEVSPSEAELLVLASEMGTLSFVLRSVGDVSPAHPANGRPAPITTDMRVSGVMREIMKGENKSGSLSQVVRVYSGTRVENVEVRPYSQ